MPYKDKEIGKRKKHEYHLKNKDILYKKKKIYYQKNRKKILEKVKIYTALNKGKVLEYKKNYYLKNKSRVLQWHKQYRKLHYKDIIVPRKLKNKSLINATMRKYRAKRIKIDQNYRIAINLRNRLLAAINSNQKAGSAIQDLGCTISDLKIYLENKFKNGMNWQNYGKQGWHIDHIKPLKDFDLTDRDQFLVACHYTNLQPLWWYENLQKRYDKS
jgi:hypothetical protein